MTGEARSRRRGLGRILDALYLGAGWLAGAFLIAIFLIMIALSGGRQIGVNVPAGDEFAAWSMAAMAFLGLAHTFKSGEMIRIGLVIERLPQRARRGFEILSLGVALAAIGYFAWFAVLMVRDSWRFNEMAQGVLAVPLWIPQIGVAAGLVILTIALLDEFVRVVGGAAPSYEKAPPASPDEFVARIAEGGGI